MPVKPDQQSEVLPAELLAQFVDQIPTGIAVFDAELRYVSANQHWLAAFQLPGPSVAGQRHDDLDRVEGAQLAELQRRALAGELVNGCEKIAVDANGALRHRSVTLRPRRGLDGAISGVVAAMHEIVTPAAGPIVSLADRLTGVAGRDAFVARLRALLANDPSASVAVFLIDIGGFRGINDLYGTRAGDQVLRTVANRLRTGVRSRPMVPARTTEATVAADLVARLGADEFGVILGSLPTSPADVAAFAARLLHLVTAPVIVGEQRIRLTGHIGYLVTGPAQRSEDDVLRDLNVALEEAKVRGPNSASAWEPTLTSAKGRRLAVLDELRRALEEGEFVLHYQPILGLREGPIVGAEALLRWNHPRDGLVAPAEFLPLLEESGLIVPVGCWVLREVVRQMQVWTMLYGRDMLEWVSVNVSARQFNDPSLLLATLGEINDSGFPLDRLKLEITESAVMRNPQVTRTVLAEMQKIGIRVALDDFGTGYSALGALRHYSVDMIKIDRDFTARLDTEDGRELIQALLSIARIYGAAVVAEGVETPAQRQLLRSLDCDYGQGYLFAKPMDGSAFGAFVLTHLAENATSAA